MLGSVPISVVIPTYNRPNALFDTIRSICSGNVIPDEIIVVDQTVPPVEFPQELQAMMHTGPLQVLHADTPSLTKSRNIGLKRAKNEIVLFCDDDILMGGGVMQALYDDMCDNHIALVAGIHYKDNILFAGTQDCIWKSVISSMIGVKKFWRKDGYVIHSSMRGRYASGISKMARTEWAMGYFFCIKKSICMENNIYFDENLIRYAYAEDLDFSYRYCKIAKKLEKSTYLDPTLYIDHLGSKEWRTPNRAAAFYTVINRRYLSYKLFPRQFWNHWLLEWSDFCWELVGCKTAEEKKNWYDARIKCRKHKKDLKTGNLNAVYE